MSVVINEKRRSLLQAASSVGLLMGSGLASEAIAATTKQDPWKQAQAIIDRFAKPIHFRKEDFLVTSYGAKTCDVKPVEAWVSFVERKTLQTPVADATDCYPAIAAAIAACHAAGGGRVVIPAGNWYVAGPIVLLSNVNVHLNAGAHVYFSNNPADYAKYGKYDCGKNGKLSMTRWEGNDCLNFSSMVYAYGQRNIALTGDDWTAILDGQAGVNFADSPYCWWSWKGREKPSSVGDIAPGSGDWIKHQKGETEVSLNPLNPVSLAEVAPHLSEEKRLFIQGEGDKWRRDSNYLRALAEAGIAADKRVFGLGHFLRPHMVQFINCSNVLFQGYQVTNTPFWQHNPVGCRNVHVKNIYANSVGPNSDGFDPESCNYVLIEDSTFDTGDDCIAVDAGKGPDVQYGPSQNIVVQNCKMHSGHGAMTFGSIMSAGIQNVFAQNLVFENSHWKTDPLNIAIRFKCNMSRGGFLKNLHIRNISIPNGIRTTPAFYATLPGSVIPTKSVATSAGAVITIDCGYDPLSDNVRTRPPVVSDIHISNVNVGNVDTGAGQFSSYQAIVVLGPVPSDYNGPASPAPKIVPVKNVTISDCDLGNPVNKENPMYLFNVKDLVLKNVRVGGTVYNKTLSV
ncbi:glycoside hydrolase family 28 protein [Undibacterium sp. FT147W]|uniref:Glycoside hydrolase family 28 protein n=1 Tax=Undibacterium rivi TaxID=2828729 RepID=A0ABS5H3T5_9BURK|nr:glycoside hydrolase family 28 protein [Undibacterium rivi]MBR7793461.1 glycoside hydrolase family 28 protein [Undibacterium rivi]